MVSENKRTDSAQTGHIELYIYIIPSTHRQFGILVENSADNFVEKDGVE